MKIRKVLNKRIRRSGDGGEVVGDVNAVVSANVGEKRPSSSHVSSRQRTRIVQRSGRTEVFEHEYATEEGGEHVRRQDRSEG
jgi:hypothetical protein